MTVARGVPQCEVARNAWKVEGGTPPGTHCQAFSLSKGQRKSLGTPRVSGRKPGAEPALKNEEPAKRLFLCPYY